MESLFDRRAFLGLSGLLAIGAALPASAQQPGADAHLHAMAAKAADAPTVAMLVYPKMVLLDLVGPMTIFRVMGFDVQLVWKERAPVSTDVGIALMATQTFQECPAKPDVLFVPGGILGTIDCMNDAEVCAFLADRGSRAGWVTSVCTGGLVLAAAGLLKGYDATAHWAVANLLPLMGARHVDARVVRDRNRMTGGGVTAGIDFALALVAEMRGEEAARRAQLIVEYAPEPPYSNGTPQQAGAARVAAMRKGRVWMDGQARLAAVAAGKRLDIGG